MLNQAVRYEFTEGVDMAGLASYAWSADADRKWLTTLGERFGKSPAVEHLAILILCYLLVVGPANFFLLKRREARVWLIGTVPVLAVTFGGIVLSMGYLSHGVRAATNYLAMAVVTPEGDRAFAQEFVAVYATTSAEYVVEFPRHLPVRPLAEYVPNPNGGFDNPASFKLTTRDDRQWLRDWRLTFWQTRGTTSLDCVPVGGRLTARRNGSEVTISNETDIPFESIVLAGGSPRHLGPLKPFESATTILSRPDLGETSGRNSPDAQVDSVGGRTGAGGTAAGGVASPRRGKFEVPTFDSTQRTPLGAAVGEDSAWPNDEARALFDAAAARVRPRGGDWVFGLTRQPIHPVNSPDTKRQIVATVYTWPVVAPGKEITGRR
jgi:hypothetical protein